MPTAPPPAQTSPPTSARRLCGSARRESRVAECRLVRCGAALAQRSAARRAIRQTGANRKSAAPHTKARRGSARHAKGSEARAKRQMRRPCGAAAQQAADVAGQIQIGA
eukprot:7382818-Prymnesium_polylepis.1